ncbi:hypothetical protein DPSP01_002880 [Paraphaeosphaeria sporulosa]
MTCPMPLTRTYPLSKPPNHTLPVPRYTATLLSSTTHLHTLYIGLQTHSTSGAITAAAHQLQKHIQFWIDSTPELSHESESPLDLTYERFTLIDHAGGDPAGSKVWVCYQSFTTRGSSPPSPIFPDIDLPSLYKTIPEASRPAIGLWKESFTTPVGRLETNYSGTDYLPGLARIPGVRVAEHELATYWGAARDRIPEAGWDLFPRPDTGGMRTEVGDVDGRGHVFKGTNKANVVHIRSGQWWENCEDEERGAYEGKLEPTLRAGLSYLNSHREESGCMRIRYLRNGEGDEDVRETCGAGFFHNLEDLERWSKTHSSHLKIWRGALAHYKAFPENRRLRTWHEVSVIREGEARWEYMNCKGGTGVMGCVVLEGTPLA